MNILPGYGEAGRHESVHRTMMILAKSFKAQKPDYIQIRQDICKYLETWKPNYQHSSWRITGSAWQPGFIKIADVLGPQGAAIRAELEKCYEDRIGDDKSRETKKAKDALEEAGYGNR